MTYYDIHGFYGTQWECRGCSDTTAGLGQFGKTRSDVVNKEWPDLHEQNGPCIWFPVVSGQIHIDMTYSVNQAK